MRKLVILHVPKYLVQFAIVFIGYFIAGKLGQATANIRSSNLGPVWPAYGIALGAILLCGYRIWPAVLSAAFVIAWRSPESALSAFGQAVGATVAAVTGVFLLGLIDFDNSVSRFRDALALVLLGGLGSAAVSASIGTFVLHSSQVHAYSGLGAAWLIYWLGDSTGVLLVTPLVLTIPSLFRTRGWGRLAELFCLLVILVALCAAVFNDFSIVPVRMMAFAILPIVIWAAVRFGVSGAAVSMFVVATVATVQTALGWGPFAVGTAFGNAVQLDAFFTVFSLTGLTLATLYSERERAEDERAQSLREQVAMEVRLQNEERLRASEERLRLAQQAAHIGTFERDLRTGLVTWSTELELMYGLSPGEFDGTTMSFFEKLIHPEDRGRVMDLLTSGLETGQPTKGKWRVIWPDGNVHWISGHWQVLRNESGEPVRVVGVNMDVTERRLAEGRLREYEEAVEGAEDMIGVIDREYRFLIVNRQYLKMRSLTREQVVGHSIADVLGKETFETVIKPKLDECFQGNVVRYEMKFSYPKVGEKHLLLSYFPIEGVNGVDRAACILHDITDRKRAEEAVLEMNRTLEAQGSLLRSREELLRAFVKSVPAAVAMLDRDMRYLQVSNRWCTDYLRGRTQILGRSHYEIFPDMPERWKEVHRRGLQGETLRADEDRWDRQDGPHWQRWEIRPWKTPEGTVGGILILAEDITRRKQMEEALRESEDKLRLLLESTAEGIYGIDLENRCTFCNPSCLRTLGYERMDEVLGKNTHDLIHRTGADGTVLPVEECRVHRVARTGEGVHAEDEVFWRANGTCFPVEYWSYPQRREGKVVGAVVAFIDITERKLAETALANISRRLIEAQEQERSRIGRELHDDIGQRLALLTVELQQLHEDRLILPKVRSRMGELQKQTVEIATDIQSLSHELHSAKLQYLGIAGAIRGFCREFGEQQKVEIDFATHDLPSPLSPDTSLCFFRVLQEALHNSAKHSGVRHFEVQLWGTSDEIHLTVKDSGAGFDREAAKTSRGLGLISMEERLKLLKGTLTIDSQPRHGTTVHARIPFSSGGDSMYATG